MTRRTTPRPGERAAIRRGQAQVKRLEELLATGVPPEKAVRRAGIDPATAEKIMPKLLEHLKATKEAG